MKNHHKNKDINEIVDKLIDNLDQRINGSMLFDKDEDYLKFAELLAGRKIVLKPEYDNMIGGIFLGNPDDLNDNYLIPVEMTEDKWNKLRKIIRIVKIGRLNNEW